MGLAVGDVLITLEVAGVEGLAARLALETGLVPGESERVHLLGGEDVLSTSLAVDRLFFFFFFFFFVGSRRQNERKGEERRREEERGCARQKGRRRG